jgi:hypothetical protein
MVTIPGMQSERDQGIVDGVLHDHREMSGNRTIWEGHWDEIARRLWPEMRDTFRPGENRIVPGEKKTNMQLDATPQIALNQFGAILDSLLTPRNQTWHRINADNEDLNKERPVQEYFAAVNKTLFRQRYSPEANFAGQNQLVYKMLGSFGTGTMFVDGAISGRGLRYKSVPIGETYFRENHQGIVDTVLRYYALSGHAAMSEFGNRLPADLREQAGKQKEKLFYFINLVQPNKDLDPQRLDAKGMAFESITISVDKKWLLREGGFHTFPYAATRYEQIPNETYGRSPAMMALPAIKTLMAQKSTILKQGHRTVDPVLLAHDDGVIDGVDLTPGAVNYGGVDAAGRALIQTLPVGRVDIGKEMMDDEREMINAAFLVHLFQILTETPRMTATEVIERTREKGILLAPTVGAQQDGYLGPLIDREIDLLNQQGLLPELPGVLVEAEGEYVIKYDSPLSRVMRAEEASGFIRTLEMVLPMVNTTGDISPLDHFDMDTITPEIADIQAMPVNWITDPEVVAAKRQARAEQAEREEDISAAPGAAALMNASGKQGAA